MKRNLIVIDAALLLAVCLVGWYLRTQWTTARQKERQGASERIAPVRVPAPPPLKKVEPIAAPAYEDIAVKNLFSKDRNPNPIPDPPPPPPPEKPMPPLPSAHCVMFWDGQPPTIVLSEHGVPSQKDYHPGDSIGPFKVVSLDNKEIVFEWEGKQVRKRLDEIMDNTLPVAENNTSTQAAAPAAQQASATTTSLSNPANNGPGLDVGGGFHACNPGDTSPPGTVVNGLKKVVTPTPFGNSCRWEAAQ